MKLGIFKTSMLENEFRVPIYPEALPTLKVEIRNSLIFEKGYGLDYGYGDDYFIGLGCQVTSREGLFESADVLVLPKPVKDDICSMRPKQVLWGWPHCVQQKEIAQAAIDNQVTLIAWEAMHHWSNSGEQQMHIFYKNNELAGYAAILHVLELLGTDGHYGPKRKVGIIGYGSVSRGAICALQGRGFNDINVYSRRPTHLIADQQPGVCYHQIFSDSQGKLNVRLADSSTKLFEDELSESDIIYNGILQDTDSPLIFIDDNNLEKLKPKSIIIDVSCDEGMGFSFAKPTTFYNPTFEVGEKITYYSVDHTPTYLWNSASREISKSIVPYLEIILSGPSAWHNDPTISRAIEIENGRVLNPKLLSFQKRNSEYPHSFL